MGQMWEDVLSYINGVLETTQAISRARKQYTDRVSGRGGGVGDVEI